MDEIWYEDETRISTSAKVDRTDSQEIDCAIERKQPIREYFELEDHPEIKRGYTINEVTNRNIKKE